ncbi:phage shock protein operon transcriptional activator [Desulfomarina profundi]|uniref:Phage shock protein operon transcriptional activator n=1 Tax=Desulfomarina profundi TaxID=2772557 RepID=A0A8D5FFE2_9BACT|nr:phage shock protein operon transcriptional activator [Desulfomarina profundi]
MGKTVCNLKLCDTIPGLIEAELFGYEKGAFTGAGERRPGRFEAADGGTLFLDEIGSIPLEAQEKILRVVEYGSFERVGSARPVEVDVRIIGATNVDLSAMAVRKDFKRDLLDRLSFEVLFLPPLRYRGEDVMLLATHFANRMAFELGRANMPVFTDAVVRQLEAYPWKGNIRELKNVIERAVYRSEEDVIDSVNFDPFVSPYGLIRIEQEDFGSEKAFSFDFEKRGKKLVFKKMVREFEVKLIRKSLVMTGNNQKKAAALLDLTYDQFRGLLRKYKEKL